MKTILAIVGFIIGIFFFVFIMKRINFVFANFYTIGMIFAICVSLGVVAAYFLGWIILIIAVLFAIYWVYKKVTSKGQTDIDSTENVVEKSNCHDNED